jgi:hypothetical protein
MPIADRVGATQQLIAHVAPVEIFPKHAIVIN